MRAAYNEILADGLKRRHPVQQIIGALLKAEIVETGNGSWRFKNRS